MSKKQFYTERDIEDMVAQGKTSLAVNDNVVLTDLAREQADKLGLSLIYADQVSPTNSPAKATPAPVAISPSDSLTTAIKTAVRAKVGNSVPDTMLNTIIAQVLAKLNDKGGNY